jgi:cell division septal protein FtsQ
MSTRYRRVAQNEQNVTAAEEKKMKAERMARITAKIHAAGWVGAAVGLLWWTDFFNTAVHDTRMNRYV